MVQNNTINNHIGASSPSGYTFPLIDGTDGQVIQTDGSGSAFWVASLPVITTTNVNIQVFFNSGTYVPTPGMKYCVIEAVGGGGGGGGGQVNSGDYLGGGGGGSGAYARIIASSSIIGSSQSVSIGVGGDGSVTTGSPGGTTTVGSLISTRGGAGGKPAASASSGSFAGGAGGTVTTGDLNITGNPGGASWNLISQPFTIFNMSGMGGSSYFGGGANSIVGTVGVGNAGASGGGGSGGIRNGFAGGSGGNGLVVITEYIYTTQFNTWTSFTTSITGTTTSPTPGGGVTNKSYYLQVGKMLYVSFYYSQATPGSAGSGTYLFNLPSGFSINTSIINAASTSYTGSVLGTASMNNIGVGSGWGQVLAYNSTQYQILINSPGSSSSQPLSSSYFNLGSTNTLIYTAYLMVPVN